MIGKVSNKVKNAVERGAVKKFAEAIGDAHPIYVDEETGKNSRYGRNIAPATFPRVFDFGEISGLVWPERGLIHGQQSYHYERPLFVGETVYCYTKVKDCYERDGGSGKMTFIVYENNGEDELGNTIFTSELVMIITEKVRKEMNV
nr:MaoC family dehydratase N-terminal domain-containing protein [Bacillus sp. B15-48]